MGIIGGKWGIIGWNNNVHYSVSRTTISVQFQCNPGAKRYPDDPQRET